MSSLQSITFYRVDIIDESTFTTYTRHRAFQALVHAACIGFFDYLMCPDCCCHPSLSLTASLSNALQSHLLFFSPHTCTLSLPPSLSDTTPTHRRRMLNQNTDTLGLFLKLKQAPPILPLFGYLLHWPRRHMYCTPHNVVISGD